MLRFIIWMILAMIAVKLAGVAFRTIRWYFQPNKEIGRRNASSPRPSSKSVEDIPYEEIKENK